jgi:hypothetical protein
MRTASSMKSIADQSVLLLKSTACANQLSVVVDHGMKIGADTPKLLRLQQAAELGQSSNAIQFEMERSTADGKARRLIPAEASARQSDSQTLAIVGRPSVACAPEPHPHEYRPTRIEHFPATLLIPGLRRNQAN